MGGCTRRKTGCTLQAVVPQHFFQTCRVCGIARSAPSAGVARQVHARHARRALRLREGPAQPAQTVPPPRKTGFRIPVQVPAQALHKHLHKRLHMPLEASSAALSGRARCGDGRLRAGPPRPRRGSPRRSTRPEPRRPPSVRRGGGHGRPRMGRGRCGAVHLAGEPNGRRAASSPNRGPTVYRKTAVLRTRTQARTEGPKARRKRVHPFTF